MAAKKKSRRRKKSQAWKKTPWFLGKKKTKAKRSRRRKKNPSRRYRNPVNTSAFREVGVLSAGAIAGGLGARIIPQSVLPTYNTGWIGYGLNLIVAFLGKWLIDRFAKMPRLGLGWAVGGVVMTVGRIVSDQWGKTVVTFGSGMSGLGYRGDAAFDLRGMGATYAKSGTPQPTHSVINSHGLMIVGANGQATKVPTSALPVASGVQVAKTATAAAATGTASSSAKPAGSLAYNPNWRSIKSKGRFAA